MNNSTFDLNNERKDTQSLLHQLLRVLYGLDNLRRALQPAEWKAYCQKNIRGNQLHEVLLAEPMTRLAYERQIDSEDDAELLDFLLGYHKLPDYQSKPLADHIFDFVFHSDPAKAIRHRRNFIAALVDETASHSNSPLSILSVGAGHIREIDVLTVTWQNNIRRLIAYDWKETHLNFVKSNRAQAGIIPLEGTIDELIAESFPLGKFDLIYAGSIFNYVHEKVARQMIHWMFDALHAKGSMLICHFREEVSNTIYRTYMEAFMEWYMDYRTDEKIIDLYSGLKPDQVSDFKFLTDPLCNIAYVVVKKR